jgi:uncharacterized protein YbaR (Trm112 family)
MNVSADLLSLVACPACHGRLEHSGQELACQSCGLVYGVRDDIPILLVDHARRS